MAVQEKNLYMPRFDPGVFIRITAGIYAISQGGLRHGGMFHNNSGLFKQHVQSKRSGMIWDDRKGEKSKARAGRWCGGCQQPLNQGTSFRDGAYSGWQDGTAME